MRKSKHIPPAPGYAGEHPSYAKLKQYVSAHGIARASYRFNLSEQYIEERLAIGEVPPEVIPIIDEDETDDTDKPD